MNKTQVIFDDLGRPAFAVIPWREYERLSNGDAESLLSDEELYERAGAEGASPFPPKSRIVSWPVKTPSACTETIAA